MKSAGMVSAMQDVCSTEDNHHFSKGLYILRTRRGPMFIVIQDNTTAGYACVTNWSNCPYRRGFIITLLLPDDRRTSLRIVRYTKNFPKPNTTRMRVLLQPIQRFTERYRSLGSTLSHIHPVHTLKPYVL